MPELNATIFKLKLTDWYRHSETLLPFTPQLTEEERQSVRWLMDAWREYAYSAALAAKAAEAIAAMAAADQAHAGNRQLKTASAAFRGIATVVYCTDADVYGQFQRELCRRAKVAIPTQRHTTAAAKLPKVLSASLCVYRNSRIVQRDVTMLNADETGTLQLSALLNSLTINAKYTFTFELVDSSNTVVRTSTAEFIATDTHGSFRLSILPCDQMPAGAHTLRVKIGTTELVAIPISKKAGAQAGTPQKKYTLDSLTVTSADSQERLDCGDNHLRTTTRFLIPTLIVASTDSVSRTVTFHVSIFTPSGSLVRGSSSPAGATYSTRSTISDHSVSLNLTQWGDANIYTFNIPGTWTIRVRANNGSEISQRFEVTAPPADYTLDSLGVISTNSEERAKYGYNRVPTTAQLIVPTITIKTPDTTSRTITFSISIITPSGQIVRDSRSPNGATYTTRRTISGQRTTTLVLRSWGAAHGRMFDTPGGWTLRVRTDDGNEISKQFAIVRPKDSKRRFRIKKVTFGNSSYVPSGANSFQPRLHIGGVSMVSPVQEVSYEIRDSKWQKIADHIPTNVTISSDNTITLPAVHLLTPLPDGQYSLVATVNGLEYPPAQFRVGKTESSWLPVLLWGTISFLIISIIFSFL